MLRLVAFLTVICAVSAKIYFLEEFGSGWEDRWVQSKHSSDYGKFIASPGKFYGDAERDTGLKTSQDARFYAIGASFPKFSNKGEDLVIQYTVKHEQNIDCGGGYLKIGPTTDLKDFHGETKYNIMFGPDICGATKRTHLIFNYKGTNHLKKVDIRTESDEFTHLYTLIVHPDQTFDVLIDNKSAASGSLLDGWDFLPPKEIPDPNVSKPSDWVDEATIPDPEDKKPEDWDSVPEFIADPDAEKPEDWDDEEDGEWEAPTIPNPDFKGEWQPKMIPNPAYKGEWVHPKIANPEYSFDDSIYAFDDFGFVGIDIWQVKSGSIFDNILIGNNADEAKDHADKTWAKLKVDEKAKFEADKEAQKQAAEEHKETSTEDSDDHSHKNEKLEALKKKQEHHHDDL